MKFRLIPVYKTENILTTFYRESNDYSVGRGLSTNRKKNPFFFKTDSTDLSLDKEPEKNSKKYLIILKQNVRKNKRLTSSSGVVT